MGEACGRLWALAVGGQLGSPQAKIEAKGHLLPGLEAAAGMEKRPGRSTFCALCCGRMGRQLEGKMDPPAGQRGRAEGFALFSLGAQLQGPRALPE